MATISSLNSTPLTTNVASYVTTAFTPVAGDLLIALIVSSGNTGGALTDSLGLGWSLITTAANTASANTLYIFVAQRFATATSMTVTFNSSSGNATGCALNILKATSMTRAGWNAVRQSAIVTNKASSTTPNPAFPAAVLTANACIGLVGNATNPATMTAPTSWTELVDTGYATPTTGLESVHIDSGFTGTTVTWGSTSASNNGAIVIELDTSSVIPILSPTEYDGTGMSLSGADNPGFDITTRQGFLSNAIAEANLGDNVEVPPIVFAASDIILMGYKGYWVPRSVMVPWDQDIEQLPVPPVVVIFNDWTNDAEYPGFNFVLNQALFSMLLPEIGIGDNVEIPPQLYFASSVTLMGWSGYSIPTSSMLNADDAVEKITLNPTTLFNDFTNDAENQFLQLGYNVDKDVSDEGVENIIIPVVAYDTDADNQKSNTWLFSSDTIADETVERIQLALTTAWDTDADNQKDNSWKFSSDTVLDEGVERIQIALTIGWDNDADNQRDNSWKVLIDDEGDFGLERITIPIVAYDNDADNQLLNSPYFGIGSDQGQEWQNLIIVPAIVSYLYSQDNDADHQKDNSWHIGDDVSDAGVEILTQIYLVSDITLLGYKGYWIPKALMIFTDDAVELVQPNIYLGWDNDSDNQLQQLGYNLDKDVSDEQTERIIIPVVAYDTDAEEQLKNPSYFGLGSDQGQDWTQLIIIPATIPYLFFWDNDADYQMQQLGYSTDKDLLDAGVERIFIPVVAYDTDADQQKDNSWKFSSDDNFDVMIEVLPKLFFASSITLMGWTGYAIPLSAMFTQDEMIEELPPVVIIYNDLSTDSENQIRSFTGFSNDSIQDEAVEYIIIPRVAFDTDADNQIANPLYQGLGSDQGQDWNLVIIIPPIVLQLTAYDTDADQQKDFSWRVGDDLADTGVEYITIPVVAYDTDSDQQKDNSWTFKSDDNFDSQVERIQLALTIGWDTDAENQRQQDGYATDRDVSDAQTERIVIPVRAYDDDGQGQLLNPLYTLDKDGFDSAVELVQIPVIAFDTDADNQLLNPSYIGIETDQGEDWQHLIIIPPIVPYLYSQDTDADNQKDNSWKVDDDVSDAGVEIIILPFIPRIEDGVDIPPSRFVPDLVEEAPYIIVYEPLDVFDDFTNMSIAPTALGSDQGSDTTNYIIIPTVAYDTDAEEQKAQLPYQGLGSDQGQEWIQLIIIPPIVLALTAWDNDAENQKDFSWKIGDDVLDAGLEKIFIPVVAYDTDADQQLANPTYIGIGSDAGQDWNLVIIIPPIVLQLTAFDNDAENQKDFTYRFSSDTLMDEGVELVQITKIILGWDNDTEQQLFNGWLFKTKHLADESVERIQIALTTGWDNDSDQQHDNSWRVEDDVMDAGVEKITLALTLAWDNDADNQISNSWFFSEDTLADEGVERITIPIIAYITDAENQKDNSWIFRSDSQVEREGTNFIILPFNDWTSPFEDQLDRSWHIGDDVLDANIEIIIPPLPIFVLGGGTVIQLVGTLGSAVPAIMGTGEVQLLNATGTVETAVNVNAEVELAINVNADVINSGDK